VGVGSVESSVTPVAASSLPEAPSTEAVALTENKGAPPSVDMKSGTEPPKNPDGSPDPEAAADLPVARAELGDIIDANAASTGPVEGEEKPKAPVAPSTAESEEFHVPENNEVVKKAYEEKFTSLKDAASTKARRELTEPEKQALRERALKDAYIGTLKPGRAEAIKRDVGYKAMRGAAAESLKAKAKPGEIVTPEAVDREALSVYLQAKDVDRDKPWYLLRQLKKKLGFGKMIAEILLAVGLSTGEQAGTQSVRSLQPGR
jgi:hypothetical protein